MKRKKQIKARIREIEKGVEFERGRLSVVNQQAQDVDLSKSISASIREKEAVAAGLRWALDNTNN
jgi:hypothetical protein